MLRYRTLAAIFPIALLLAVAAERTATWLLGTFPGERIVWMVSGELRRILRPVSEALTVFTGGSLTLQAALIVLCLVAVRGAFAVRRWEAPALMLNHLALIAFLAVSYLSSGASTAGMSFAGWQLNEASLLLAEQTSALHVTLLAIGVAGCIFSHFCFLSDARARQQAFAAAVTELCAATEGRRPAKRNRPSRSR